MGTKVRESLFYYSPQSPDQCRTKLQYAPKPPLLVVFNLHFFAGGAVLWLHFSDYSILTKIIRTIISEKFKKNSAVSKSRNLQSLGGHWALSRLSFD